MLESYCISLEASCYLVFSSFPMLIFVHLVGQFLYQFIVNFLLICLRVWVGYVVLVLVTHGHVNVFVASSALINAGNVCKCLRSQQGLWDCTARWEAAPLGRANLLALLDIVLPAEYVAPIAFCVSC